MKKKLKIVLLAVAGLVILYHLMFYHVVGGTDSIDEIRDCYDGFMITVKARDSWPLLEEIYDRLGFNALAHSFMSGGYSGGYKHMFMFRWSASALKKRMIADLTERLEELKRYEGVDYTYDVEDFSVQINIDANWAEKEGNYYEIIKQIRSLQSNEFSRLCILCKKDLLQSHFQVKENERDMTFSKVPEFEFKELKKILKKSKKKAPENLFQWDGIRLNDSQTSIKRLDLSAYPDISGELDLSVFEKLEYVSLKGLKVSNVILPESLSYLDADSFKNCEKIQQIRVPKNVKTMYSPAFAGCKSLKTVIFEGNAPDIVGNSNGNRVDDVFGKGMEKVQIYCRKNSKGWVESCWDKYEKIRFE